MRFVFVTDELPRSGVAGHLALNHAIIDWLHGQGHEVTVLLVGARLNWPVMRCADLQVAGPAVYQFGTLIAATAPRALLRILVKSAAASLPAKWRKRLRGQAYGGADAVLGAFTTASQAAWCAAYITRHQPDAVLADTIFRAGLLRLPALAGVNSVIVAHDVFHRRHAAIVSAGYRVFPAALSRADEAGWLARARGIAAIQPEEAALIRAMCPDKNVFTAAMPAIPCPRPESITRLAGRLVFVGSASLPNLDGLRWFFESVWPSLRRWRPFISLDLAGDCGQALANLPEGVNRLGRVRDLTPVLHQASLAVAPLRVGSGLKIKLLDYARHGLMTVATPSSLEGFAADENAPFIAAANATGFALAVLNQLEAGAAPDDRALAYVTRHYGVAASFAGLGVALGLPVTPR
jgi:succinoglycan biosynthesis protein ExoO